jgi:hypothetical protein
VSGELSGEPAAVVYHWLMPVGRFGEQRGFAVLGINACHRHYLTSHVILALATLAFAALMGQAQAEDIAISCRFGTQKTDTILEISNNRVFVDDKLMDVDNEPRFLGRTEIRTRNLVITSRLISFTIFFQITDKEAWRFNLAYNINRITGDATVSAEVEGKPKTQEEGTCVKAPPRKF